MLIRLENVKKIYNPQSSNPVRALDGVDLKIAEGEFVAIMGPSGSGKSSLMHVLGFLDHLTSGKYFFESQNVTDYDNSDLAEIRNRQIGFVFQAFNLLARTTALENVMLPMLYAGELGSSRMQQRAYELLSKVGLADRFDHEPSELSGGQQQRVAIARALANDPKVIFADEPTGNLDSKSSYEIMDLFTQLNDDGRTLIFVTHEPDISKYAKRILKLKDGKIVSDRKR